MPPLTQKEHPLILSGPMVRAYLAGRKTQTRRSIKPQPEEVQAAYQAQDGSWIFWYPDSPNLAERTKKLYKSGGFKCPHGRPGDRLWVREKFAYGYRGENKENNYVVFFDGGQKYRDGAYYSPQQEYSQDAFSHIKWKPSIHMPRWASRIILEITNIRVERVQAISEEDAIAEGVEWLYPGHEGVYKDYLLRTLNGCVTAKESYMTLWESLYRRKPKLQWQANPWVFVIEFRKCQD